MNQRRQKCECKSLKEARELVALTSKGRRLTKEELMALAERACKGLEPISVHVEFLERFYALATGPIQAELDRLMLEFVPEEVLKEQFDNWANHQVPYTGPEHV